MRSRPHFKHVLVLLTALLLGLSNISSGWADPPVLGATQRPNYPKLWPQSQPYYWLALKCKLSNVSGIQAGFDTAINQFLGITGGGYGNIPDYFYDVSYGHVWTGLRPVNGVVGWINAPFASTDLHPGGWLFGKRARRVEVCMEAIPVAQRPDLSGIYGIAGIENGADDGGACGVGQINLHFWGQNHSLACVWFDRYSLFTDFAAQEIGHGLGLDHSWDDSGNNCSGQPGEYCDRWDVMSSMGVLWFRDTNWDKFLDPTCIGTIGACGVRAGPGLSAPSLLKMQWLPSASIGTWPSDPSHPHEESYTLQALSHPIDGLLLAVKVYTGSNSYTVEYRQPDGWDAGFASNGGSPAVVQSNGGLVLVHELKGNPAGVLLENANLGARMPGDLITLPSTDFGNVYVRVGQFDTYRGNVTIRVGLSPPDTPPSSMPPPSGPSYPFPDIRPDRMDTIFAVDSTGRLIRFQHLMQDKRSVFPPPFPPVWHTEHALHKAQYPKTGWSNLNDVTVSELRADGLIVYGMKPNGDLIWREITDLNDPLNLHSLKPDYIEAPRSVGNGWNNLSYAFSTGEGIIYGVTPNGELIWYHHIDNGDPSGGLQWEHHTVRSDWGQFVRAFSPGRGIIYAVRSDGLLFWFRHKRYLEGGRENETGAWSNPTQLGWGWDSFKQIFATYAAPPAC